MNSEDALMRRPDLTPVQHYDPFTPESISAAISLAEELSKANLVPKDLRSDTGSIVIIMAQSHALGIPWTTGLQEIHTIHGRISYSAQLLKALAEKDPAFEFIYVDESDDESATVKAKRREWDEPKEYTVTIGDARKAGYLDGRHSGVWKTRPRIMLAWMALRESARLWGSGTLLGMYTDEEIETVDVSVEVVDDKAKTKAEKLTAAVKKDLAKDKPKKTKDKTKKVAREAPPLVEVETLVEEVASDEEEKEAVGVLTFDDVASEATISDEDLGKVQDYVRQLEGGITRQKSIWAIVKIFMQNHSSMKPGYRALSEVPASKVDLIWKQLVKAEEGIPVEEAS